MAEQRAIREELENRCPTPEITYADDDPDRPPDNFPSNSATFIDPRPWTTKTRDVHASQLKPFRFNLTSQSLTDTARRDYMEFFIEDIVSHVEIKKIPSKMKFYVKWLNYDSNHNSWEPWKSMRATDQLHTYLRVNNMLYVIPNEFRNMTPNNREEP